MAIVDTNVRNAMLSALQDGTTGLTQIKLQYDDLSFSAKQNISFGAPSSGEINQSSDVVFSVASGKTVMGFVLIMAGDETGILHSYETLYSFANAGTFTVRNTRITVS